MASLGNFQKGKGFVYHAGVQGWVRVGHWFDSGWLSLVPYEIVLSALAEQAIKEGGLQPWDPVSKVYSVMLSIRLQVLDKSYPGLGINPLAIPEGRVKGGELPWMQDDERAWGRARKGCGSACGQRAHLPGQQPSVLFACRS